MKTLAFREKDSHFSLDYTFGLNITHKSKILSSNRYPNYMASVESRCQELNPTTKPDKGD